MTQPRTAITTTAQARPGGRTPRGGARSAAAARRSAVKTALFVVITIPYLYPLLFLVSTALKRPVDFQRSAAALPTVLTWENFSRVWSSGGLDRAVVNSLLAVGVSVVVTGAVSALGAFWFLRHEGRFATALRLTLIGTLALPAPVFLVPLFTVLSDLRLTDNLVVLGVVYGTANARLGVYLMLAYYRSVPREIQEAARVDGASLWQQFSRVLLPVSLPALATVSALSFVWAWGDLLAALILASDPGSRTVTVAVTALAGQFNTGTTVQAAGVVIGLVPMLLVFLLAQRFLTSGLTAGAVK